MFRNLIKGRDRSLGFIADVKQHRPCPMKCGCIFRPQRVTSQSLGRSREVIELHLALGSLKGELLYLKEQIVGVRWYSETCGCGKGMIMSRRLGCGRCGWRLRAVLGWAESESVSFGRVDGVVAAAVMAKCLLKAVSLEMRLRTMGIFGMGFFVEMVCLNVGGAFCRLG